MNYKYKFNPRENTFNLVPKDEMFHVKDSVATYNDLPVTGNGENDLRSVRDTDKLYAWSIASPSGNLSDWKDVGGNGSSVWGGITGTLSNQIDLQNVLTANADKYTQLEINTMMGDHIAAYDHTMIGKVGWGNVVIVGKGGYSNYSTLADALSSITDNAEDKRYTILVMPGEYDEAVTLKTYVDIVGIDRDSVIISKTISNGSEVVKADAVKNRLANLTIEVTRITAGTPQCINVIGFGVDFTVDNVRMISVSGDSDGIQVNMSHKTCRCNIINTKIESNFDGIDILGKGIINIVNPIVEAKAQDAIRVTGSDGADCTVNVFGGYLKGLAAGLNLGAHNGKLRVLGTLIESAQYSIYGNGGSGLDAQFIGVRTATSWYGVYTTGQPGASQIYTCCNLFGSRNGINVAGSGSIDDVEFHKCIIRTTNEGSYDDILLNNSNANLKLYDCQYDTVTLTNGKVCNLPSREEFHTFTDAATTPSVALNKKFKTNNSAGTIITNFTDGINGQEIFIIFGDGNTTIDKDAGNIKLSGNLDWVPATDDTLTLVYDGSTWFEKCRSDNT